MIGIRSLPPAGWVQNAIRGAGPGGPGPACCGGCSAPAGCRCGRL